MSVSYAPVHLQVPEGFQTLLEGLTREVLRQQPDDIISFAAQYFRYRLEIRQSGGSSDPSTLGETSATQPAELSQQPSTDTRRVEAAVLADTTGNSLTRLSDSQEPPTGTDASVGSTVQLSNNQEELSNESASRQTEDFDLDLTDPMLGDAAVKIQASFRGMQIRKKLKTENKGGENDPSDDVGGHSSPVAEVKEADEADEQLPADTSEGERGEGSDNPLSPDEDQGEGESTGGASSADDDDDDIIDDDGGESLDEDEPMTGGEDGDGGGGEEEEQEGD